MITGAAVILSQIVVGILTKIEAYVYFRISSNNLRQLEC